MNRDHDLNAEDDKPPVAFDDIVGFVRNVFAGFGMGCAFLVVMFYLWR